MVYVRSGQMGFNSMICEVGNKLKRYWIVFVVLLLVSCGGEVPKIITEGDAQIPVDLDKRETVFGTGESGGI